MAVSLLSHKFMALKPHPADELRQDTRFYAAWCTNRCIDQSARPRLYIVHQGRRRPFSFAAHHTIAACMNGSQPIST